MENRAVNEDGTTTLTVATEPDEDTETTPNADMEQIIDDKNVYILRIPNENEEQN